MKQHPLLEFGEHMMTSGEPIETGETWTLENGWRAYMRCGQKVLTLKPREMRKLGEMYRDWPESPEDVRKLGRDMIEAANAAKDKNKRHVIPDGAAQFVPHQGRYGGR